MSGTRTPTRESLIGAIVLGLSLLHCCNKKETVATLDEPLEIEWIYRKSWTGSGRFGGVSESGTVEVKAPAVKFDAGCWEPKPQLGATKSEVAYRCDEGVPWRLRYLGQTGAYAFAHCDEVLGNGKEPDFTKMPSFEAAAARLVECGSDDDKKRPEPNYASLFGEIKARAGDARLADILLGSVDLPFRVVREYDGKVNDDWEDGYAFLPPAEKKRVDAELEKMLQRKNPSDSFLDRALWHVPPLGQHLKDVYRARVQDLRGKKTTVRSGRALLALLARLQLLGDAEAGATACDVLKKRDLDDVRSGLLEVIAFASYRCEHVLASIEQSPCHLSFDCGEGDKSHLCTKQELHATLAAEVKAFATERGAQSDVQAPDLAAAYVFDELPKSVLLSSARRRYQGPGEEADSCYNQDAALDVECDCFGESHDKEQAVCELDGGTEGRYHKGCRIVIDDAKKRVMVFPEPKDPSTGLPKPKPSGSTDFPLPPPSSSGRLDR